MIKEFCVEMSFSYITYIGTILFGQVSATSNGKNIITNGVLQCSTWRK